MLFTMTRCEVWYLTKGIRLEKYDNKTDVFMEEEGLSNPGKYISGSIKPDLILTDRESGETVVFDVKYKSSFDRHLQKILKLLNMTVEDLMLYHLTASKLLTATVYSQNAPMIHEMNDTAKKQYNLLLDVIDLCAIYY